jgi:hypothetical protein
MFESETDTISAVRLKVPPLEAHLLKFLKRSLLKEFTRFERISFQTNFDLTKTSKVS